MEGLRSWLQLFRQVSGSRLVSFGRGYMGVITDFQICIGLPSTPCVIPNSWAYSSLRIAWVGLQTTTGGEWDGETTGHTLPKLQQIPSQRRRAWGHPCRCAHHLGLIASICHEKGRGCGEGEILRCLGTQRLQGCSSGRVIGKEGIKITFDIPLLRSMLHIKAKAAACCEERLAESSPNAAVRSPLPC